MFAVDGLFEMVQLSNRRLGEFHKKNWFFQFTTTIIQMVKSANTIKLRITRIELKLEFFIQILGAKNCVWFCSVIKATIC